MLFRKPDAIREPLYAIVPLQNPWRWRSRWKLTERAIKHFMDSGVIVVLVEAAFGRRDFAFADSGIDRLASNLGPIGTDHDHRHMYIGLRTRDELWLKENLINTAIARLPYNWQQVCWLDSDVKFMRDNWVGECIHQLQHYAFLQMFSHARDLGPNYEMLPEDHPHADGSGFVEAWSQGLIKSEQDLDDAKAPNWRHRPHPHHPHHHHRHHHHHHPHPPHPPDYPPSHRPHPPHPHPHPYEAAVPYGGKVWAGLAWAARREAWDRVGGLIDFAVWGGGDWHLSHCLIGKSEGMMRNDLTDTYKRMLWEYFERCQGAVRQNVGVMSGSIVHHWHGKKEDRGYNTKHALLAKIGFDPLRHLKRDYQGLYQLHDDGSRSYVQLRDTLRQIAKLRNEDSNDI